MDIKHKPYWFHRKLDATYELGNVRKVLSELELHTVCTEAKCPNRNKCFSSGQATFLIMGDVCTRNCRFCAIAHGKCEPLDSDEPERVADAVKKLNLKYVVITSVTRDDLPDGGAEHFAKTIVEIRRIMRDSGIEILTPDFLANKESLDIVLEANPDVFNHNIETIPRLYSIARPQADFQRSLGVLKYASKNFKSVVKSGFMVGLGENKKEVFDLLETLRETGADVVTIGQYLQPTLAHLPIDRFVHPDEFDEYSEYGENKLGFKRVFSGPFVRSSFMAQEIWHRCRKS
ncbi:lipoyl synthase [bacterium]|nr:lipoyl synthase [bacterium]